MLYHKILNINDAHQFMANKLPSFDVVLHDIPRNDKTDSATG